MVHGDSISGSLGGRRIRFWTPIGADAFQLVSLKGREDLSRLFSFDLQFRAAAYTNPSLA